MRCERHGLATGPDGRCALCNSVGRKLEHAGTKSRDPARRVAMIVVGLVAVVAAYALIASVADTNTPKREHPVDASR